MTNYPRTSGFRRPAYRKEMTLVMANPNRLTATDCIALIKEMTGKEIKLMTWHSYAHRGQAPAAVEKIGNTPLWRRGDVVQWIENRPGHGARTDLRPARTRRTKKPDTE